VEGNPREGAIALALRIIDLISAPFDLGGNQANIGTSVGIAFAPQSGLDAESLLKNADLALYAAKSEGRNDYRLFEPEMAEASDIQKLFEGELRQAIQRNEFELHYQPVFAAETGAIRGVEALVRWRHPVKGLIAPDQFIPLAESTGLMMPLGEWILQRACTDAAAWPPHVKLAVNVSAVQFNNANLFDLVLCSLVESGLPPERLELEITETMLLKNEQACLLTVRQLKNLGIAIVLDDFGIGYSSASYLTRVPFDKVKIDRSFVHGFPGRRECAAIVQSVLALGRGLDMEVTAEGVETREQFEALRAAGVDLVQGNLLGRPVALEELDFGPGQSLAMDVA
jgi:predicted signal transduction protein with EAL and GGDEF domain